MSLTWRDRDRGVRVFSATCRCGRSIYLRPTSTQIGELARCAGSGNFIDDCWCPETPKAEAS